MFEYKFKSVHQFQVCPPYELLQIMLDFPIIFFISFNFQYRGICAYPRRLGRAWALLVRSLGSERILNGPGLMGPKILHAIKRGSREMGEGSMPLTLYIQPPTDI